MSEENKTSGWSVTRWAAAIVVAICVVSAGEYVFKKKPYKDISLWQSEPDFMEGRVVTDAVRVENRETMTLPHTAYLFEEPLAPKARLLKVRPWRDRYWFAGDTGLIRFNPETEEWMIYDRDNGLPSDTASKLAIDARKGLIIETYKRQENNSILSKGTYWVTSDGFEPAHRTLGEAVVGRKPLVSNMDLHRPNFIRSVKRNGYIWVSSHGDYKTEKEDFAGGGVYRIDPQNNKARFWGRDDGLARGYSHEITLGRDGNLWVTHWDEDRGLSRIDPETGKVEVIKQSKNGVELGGVAIASAGEYLLIGQQQALVLYDVDSRQAISIDERGGLPGYIVSDVYVDDTEIWVTAYSYEGDDRKTTGAISFDYSDIEEALTANSK